MKKMIFSVMLMVCTLSNLLAQPAPPKPTKISDKEKGEVIKNICQLVKEEYVFPEVGEQASKKLKESFTNGKYKEINDAISFSNMLTMDLQTITSDKHFRVVFDPGIIQEMKNMKPSKQDSIEMEKRQKEELRKENFGFVELKILSGNIGYLKLNGFSPLDMAKETITSAMNFLSNTDALIIDLTENRGGSLDMPPYLASYFLGEKPQILLQFLDRKNKEQGRTESDEKLEAKRYTGKPLYILTSNLTVSAAEAFSYTLKNRKVATLVGETTVGAANPNHPKILNANFVLALPSVRPIDPITGTNWEGKGITPDIEASAKNAKNVAHIAALESIAKKSNDPAAQWQVDILKGKLNPVKLNEATLKSYAGKYGARNLIYEDGVLLYQKEGQPKSKLLAISQNTFVFEDNNDLKVEITIENNRVTGFKRVFIDGNVLFEKRD